MVYGWLVVLVMEMVCKQALISRKDARYSLETSTHHQKQESRLLLATVVVVQEAA